MICQACGKRNATTQITTIVNGRLSEQHLCAQCAKAMGYEAYLNAWGMDFGSFLGGLMGAARGQEDAQRCTACGMSFAEIAKSGKVGCAQCYKSFRQELTPSIQRIHGTTVHKGKRPGSSALRVVEQGGGSMVAAPSAELERKKEQLRRAIEAQEYEQAAVLRDEIREMEAHG